MKLVVDVHYQQDDYAVASGILFEDWQSASVVDTISVRIDQIMPYQPGRFFERELPCILALFEKIAVMPELIVIDGYVTLGDEQKDGLGAHLYRALHEAVPVIGVAKNSFTGTPVDCQILRGESKNPLYITSAGVDLIEAKAYIQSMHGKHRLPTLLKRVDAECRRELQGRAGIRYV